MVEVPVLDHGFVDLDAHCASDLSVVNSARVSLHKRHEEMEDGDAGLIGFLMKNRHGTPFEHSFFRFRIKAPIFVFREWHRHRIGHSYNEWSARYSQLAGEFYVPENVRQQFGKPGAYTYEAADPRTAALFRSDLEEASADAYARYEAAIENGVAREQARLFLPVNIYSEMYWSCNARSLMAFLSLRMHPSAQWEIRQYADAVDRDFATVMPITHGHFHANGRTAP